MTVQRYHRKRNLKDLQKHPVRLIETVKSWTMWSGKVSRVGDTRNGTEFDVENIRDARQGDRRKHLDIWNVLLTLEPFTNQTS
jgi:hypothetical protein